MIKTVQLQRNFFLKLVKLYTIPSQMELIAFALKLAVQWQLFLVTSLYNLHKVSGHYVKGGGMQSLILAGDTMEYCADFVQHYKCMFM